MPTPMPVSVQGMKLPVSKPTDIPASPATVNSTTGCPKALPIAPKLAGSVLPIFAGQMPAMRTTIIRRAHFNAAHRVFRKDWSDEQNRNVFGPCSNPLYHGHNYGLEVQVTGLVNPETGYVMDLRHLKEIIQKEVIEPFDHRNLNLDTEEFREVNPTAENIARIIYEKIRKHLPQDLELRICLSETENNRVEYPAG